MPVPDALAGRADGLAAGLLAGLAAALACLAVWAWRRRHRPGAPTPVVGVALAAAGGAGIVAATDPPATLALPLPWIAVVAGVAGALLAGFDRRWRGHGLAPLLLAVSAVGVYATVPDVEWALVVVGAALPLILLGWPGPLAPGGRRGPGRLAGAPQPPPVGPGPGGRDGPAQPPSLGVAGSLAAAALLAWTVAAGGAGRLGSVVGGLACLGVLAVEPLARLLDPRHRSALARPRVAWTALAAHLVLVAVAARVVGRTETVAAALSLAGLALAAALAVALAAAASVERTTA
jgi:hypothetical protein